MCKPRPTYIIISIYYFRKFPEFPEISGNFVAILNFWKFSEILQPYLPLQLFCTYFILTLHCSRYCTPGNMSTEVITINHKPVTYRLVPIPGDGACLFHS